MRTIRDTLAILLLLLVGWMLWIMAFPEEGANPSTSTTTVVETCDENACLIPPLVIEREAN